MTNRNAGTIRADGRLTPNNDTVFATAAYIRFTTPRSIDATRLRPPPRHMLRVPAHAPPRPVPALLPASPALARRLPAPARLAFAPPSGRWPRTRCGDPETAPRPPHWRH